MMKFILLILYSLKYCKKFHLLLHEGSNIFCLCSDFMFLDFNPYSHEGSDRQRMGVIELYGISIHTPTKGVTKAGSMRMIIHGEFQSTLPRRE